MSIALASAETPVRGVAIAGTFTAEPIAAYLSHCTELVGLPMALSFAPYGQIFQELLAPESTLSRNTGGANLLLVRFGDFLRARPRAQRGEAGPHAESDEVFLRRTGRELAAAIEQFALGHPLPLILALPPNSPTVAPELSTLVESATRELVAAVSHVPNVVVLPAEKTMNWPLADPFDPQRDEAAHIPYREEYFASLAATVAREIHRRLVAAHKVLVLDCDNTLWRGIVGEDGVQGITFTPQNLALQRYAVEQHARGTLLCLCSKNAERDVFEVFETYPDLPLRPEHLVSWRINWESKADNLQSLADELNLGLDSFAFVDDSPLECEQIRSQLPQVLTLELSPELDVASILPHWWAFDKVAVTDEDLRRTQLYRENAARQRFEVQAKSIGDFLAGLELRIEMAPPSDDEWPRVSQLTQRTNQFNFTTLRRSEAELQALQQGGASVLRVRVSDRFGDYGIVGLLVASQVGEALEVDTFLLSCRALGRGVEHAMLRRLGELAVERGATEVALPYRATAKNEPARAFADSVTGLRFDEGDSIYRVPAPEACTIEHHPGADPGAGLAAATSERGGPRSATVPIAGKSDRHRRLIACITSAQALLDAVNDRRRRLRDLASVPAPPVNQDQADLLRLWEELLAIEGLGIDDNYFDLGGTSLLAVQLFAEITRRFGVNLPLTTILEAPTVRELTGRVAKQGGREDTLVLLRAGGKRTLFFVHDGDGETLLYRNLALRLPDDVTVYGIQPFRSGRIPLAHTQFEAMAADYVREVKRVCPNGPYLFAGLCAGGTIAFEMAMELERQGEHAELVAILDAAAPTAEQRPVVAARRWSRLQDLIAGDDPLGAKLQQASQTLRRVVEYETRHRIGKVAASARFRIVEQVVARQKPWPAWMAPPSFRELYLKVEARYAPGVARRSRIVLFRATGGGPDDVAYRELCVDPSLGWNAHVEGGIEVFDVAGGHAGMLTEPDVRSVAAALGRILETPGELPNKLDEQDQLQRGVA